MIHNQNTQPIQCHYKDNYFTTHLENDLYLPVLYHESQTYSQTLILLYNRTEVTLNTNKTETCAQSAQTANYAELVNAIKFLLPAMDDLIPKSPILFNYFYNEQTELNDTFLYVAQQQDPVIRKILLWKRYKNTFPPPH